MVAVGAQIEDIPPIGKECCQLRDVPQERVHAYGAPVTVSEHRVIAVSAYQGNVDHVRVLVHFGAGGARGIVRECPYSVKDRCMWKLAVANYAIDVLCLLYTSDAADDLLCVDLGGRCIIKKKIY